MDLDEADARLAEAEDLAASPPDAISPAGPIGAEEDFDAVRVVEVTPEELATEELAAEEVGGTFVGFEDAAPAAVPPEVEAEEVLIAAFAPLRPGDVAQTSIAIWQPDALAAIREQIREVQARFVDEPAEAVAQIRALVSDAVHTLADALLAEQLGSIDPHQRTDHPDTESLRVALRRYREFLDRVLAL